jgi:hypothetical protein
VVDLGPKGAQLVLIKILEWLEYLRKQGKSFSGSITLNDRIFFSSLGTVIINLTSLIDWKHLMQPRYRKDCLVVVEFIEKYLKYKDRDYGRTKYTTHVDHLKMAIEKLKDEGSNYKGRSYSILLLQCQSLDRKKFLQMVSI